MCELWESMQRANNKLMNGAVPSGDCERMVSIRLRRSSKLHFLALLHKRMIKASDIILYQPVTNLLKPEKEKGRGRREQGGLLRIRN